MKISTCSASLQTQNINIQQYQRNETLKYWDKNHRLEYASSNLSESYQRSFQRRDILELTREANNALANSLFDKPLWEQQSHAQDTLIKKFGEDFIADAKLRLIRDLLEYLTGRKIKIFGEDDKNLTLHGQGNECKEAQAQQSAPESSQQNMEGWGLDYSCSEETYTKEGFQFSAQGTLTTQDGRKIDFSASLEMSREYSKSVHVSIKAGDALKDPLVINFDGAGAQLGDSLVLFDLNNDSAPEKFNFLKPGSGFLSLDKNSNGIIDNGTELFGPQTNNGFQELAAYDEDNNNWIDENDSIFDKLRIWEKDDKGNDIITTLRDKGIGAIFLNSATSLFSLADSAQNMTGNLRETGLYLSENGKPGFVQELDLVV